MRFPVLLSMVLLALAASQVAVAADKAVQVDLAAFEKSRTIIERALEDRDAYSELTSTQRRDVMEALSRMGQTLASAPSVSQLNDSEKVRLFNDQELVNNVLTEAAKDSRLICRQDTKTGSHRKITTCRTVAEIRREKDNGQERVRRIQRSHMAPPPGG